MAAKSVSFGKADKELVDMVEKYQHEKEIQNFTEAVRRLLKLALQVEKMRG